MKEEVMINNKKTAKLWNKNFFLLWQGQLVSALGDVLYMMALDFWVFEITGSTAIMGILSAVTMLPRIILGPFAGVFVDKWHRRNVIVITDFIRGVVITFVGVAGIMGFIQVWMVFVVGVVSGLCSAFFGPAVSAIKPELVDESKLVQANSATSMADSGMQIAGTAIGGLIYVAIGAPWMFFLNGISYLLSALSEVFIKEPEREKNANGKKLTFKEDFIGGLRFIWDFKTLRNIMISACFLNLLGASGSILMLPYFKITESLGPEKYGVFMAVMSVAVLCGSAILSCITIKKKWKYLVFASAVIISMVSLDITFLISNYYVMLVLIFISGFCTVVFNTIFNTLIAIVVPADKRGKVSAMLGTISMGMSPLGALIGGVMGEIFPIRTAIIILFTITIVVGVIIASVKGVRSVISYESSDCSVDELIEKTNSGAAI